MRILSPESAIRYYSEIEDVDGKQHYQPGEKIRDLRTVSDNIFKEITRNSRRFLSCTGSRSAYVFDTYNIEKELKDELDGFRYLANDRTHEFGVEVTEEDYLAGVKALSSAIRRFAETDVPKRLLAKYINRQDLSLRKYIKKQKFETVDFLALTVRKITRPKEEYIKRRTTIEGVADGIGDVQILLWDDTAAPEEKQFSSMAEKLWPYCRLHLFNLNYNEQQDSYSTAHNTLMVVQPDYLIDASELAECFDNDKANPAVTLLKRLFHTEPKKELIFGSIVNSLLDGIVLQPNVKLADLFKDAIQENPLGMLHLCNKNGVYDNNELMQMLHKANEHGGTIVDVLKRYQGYELQLEPTFLSDRFGLQGRLDVFAINKQERHRLHIIELKSGKLPWNNAHLNPSHLMQVQCYEMLIDSAFDIKPEQSAIMYSSGANAQEAIRELRQTQKNQALLLCVRNQIVINEYRLSHGELDLIDKLQISNFGHLPKFETEKLTDFEQVMQDAADLERSYFSEFSTFVAREHRTAKIGSDEDEATEGFAGLWRQSLSKKIENYNLLNHLQMSDTADPSHIVLKKGENLFSSGNLTNFREGDIGVLYPMIKGDSRDVLRTRVLKCSIKKVTEHEVHVSLRNKQVNKAYFEEHNFWAIEHDLLEKGYREMHKSLFNLMKAPKEKRDLLFGLQKPVFDELSYQINGDLSDEQRSLVHHALSAKNYFLLQGPPGTGKTSRVLRQMAENLYKQTDECFAIIAFTNRAVDEICEHLQRAELPYIRLSKRFSEDPNTLNYIARNNKLNEVHERINNTRIFVSTQNSFNSCYDITYFKRFQTVIVDEASQLLEPQLVGLLSVFERFILIGDDKQMPAVVTQPERYTSVENETLKQAGFTSLKDSLFARLIRTCEKNGWHDAYGMLTAQGRMHQDIAAFVNARYYGSRLTTLSDGQRQPQVIFKADSDDKYERALSKARIIFIPTTAEKSTKVNQTEVEHIEKLLKTLSKIYGADFNSQTVGVVTPYRSQIASILRSPLMQKAPYTGNISVDTVERFQGSERDVIILSMAVNKPLQLSMLQSMAQTPDGNVDRKLNVALTRAKHQLVIMGCEEVLNKSDDYAALIEHIKQHGGFIDWL